MAPLLAAILPILMEKLFNNKDKKKGATMPPIDDDGSSTSNSLSMKQTGLNIPSDPSAGWTSSSSMNSATRKRSGY